MGIPRTPLLGSFHRRLSVRGKEGPALQVRLTSSLELHRGSIFSCGLCSPDSLVLEVAIAFKIRRGGQNPVSFSHTDRTGIARAPKVNRTQTVRFKC